MSNEITAAFIEKHHPKVKELMLQRQEEQTGKRDWNVFKGNIVQNKKGGGFDWDDTPETYYTWDSALLKDKLDLLYKFHPEWGSLDPFATDEYYKWLERRIELTREDKDLSREHWAFCKAMEKYRQIN